MNFPFPIYPFCPSGMSASDFADLIRSRPHCAKLMHGKCKEPCFNSKGEYRVERDHIVPEFLGGPDTLDNSQFLCIPENRWVKSVNPDNWYGKKFWFDEPPNLKALNPSQYHHGWDIIQQYREHFSNPPNVLFDRVWLLPWIMGAGKTIGMLAILCSINNIRLQTQPHCRRISRALWFAPQEGLVDRLAKELKEVATKLGLWSAIPVVIKIKKPADWEIAQNQHADIVIACPQAIWLDEGARSKSDDEIKGYLSRMEALIFDEAHWGTERLLSLADLMPKDSFKFALTATPMDKKGVFFNKWSSAGKSAVDRFAIFSIADYDEVHSHGQIRELPPWERGLAERNYVEVKAGDGVNYANGKNIKTTDSAAPNDVVRSLRIIRDAVSQVERDDKLRAFDGHVIIVSENKENAKLLCQSLRDQKVLGSFSGRGWNPITCLSGRETEINFPDLKKDHPWLKSLDTEGHCDDDHNATGKIESSRIVIVVDLFMYGINQRYATTLVYCAKSLSLIELAQRIGRLLRVWKLHDEEPIRIYFSNAFGMAKSLQDAITYLLNIRERLEEAGFITLEQVLESRSEINAGKTVFVSTITDKDKAEIDEYLGQVICSMGQEPTEDDENRIIDCWRNTKTVPPSEGQINDAKDYVEKMRDFEFRKRRLISTHLKHSDILLEEEPPKEFTRDQVIQAIKTGIIWAIDNSIEKTIEWALKDDLNFKRCQHDLTEHEKQFYINPPLVMKLADRLNQIASELFQELKVHWAELNFKKNIGTLCKCVNIAAATHFQTRDVRETTIGEKQPQVVDAATRIFGTRQIKTLAKIRLIQRYPEMAPAFAAVYRGAAEETSFSEDLHDE